MPLEQVGLEAIFDTKEFLRGQRIYERGLARINASTKKAAQVMNEAWVDPTAGLEDMFGTLDRMEGQADDIAADYAKLATEVGAVAAGLGTVAAAATGVGIGLAIVGAAGLAVWNKIDEAAMEYLGRSKEVIKAQERVNDEWDQASRHLAQTLIPLKVELLEIELKIAETVTGLVETFKKLTAIAHASLAAAAAQFAVFPQIISEALKGEVPTLEEIWERIGEAGQDKFRDVMQTYADAFEETFPEIEEEAEDTWDRTVDAVNDALNRIEDLQIAHNRRLADLADDYRIKQERAWAKYEASIVKEIVRGQKAIAKVQQRYEDRRVKAIANYTKRVMRAEETLARNIAKAQADFALRESQAAERHNLDRIQSERRYQFERNRLIAEGDTLAIEELDARYKLEQEEARENERLRQRQAQETQDAMVRAMEAAGRAQAEALAESLAEQLAELEEQSRREVAEREQANRERIDEMAAGYADQQRMADEDYQRSIGKANLNYQRQQEDLGRNLAQQEELQELGAENVERLLDRYYGEDGIAERIMKTWHEREDARIAVTAALLASLAGIEWTPLLPGGIPMPGQQVGMDEGGVVTGPATVQVGAGITEAFIPIQAGGGGSFDVSWSGGPIPITGLEGASPSDVSQIARELAISLTEKLRSRRRH